MKISKVQTTVVTVPFTRPEIWAQGARPCITSVILELTTDNGITGLGETLGDERAAAQIEAMVRSGLDPFELELLRQRYSGRSSLYAAVETALLDIQGKAIGEPVHKLFGGAVRRKVVYMYYLLRDHPKVMAEEALKAAEAGFDTIYIKVGIDVKEDLEAIRNIREAIGMEPKLRIDPNEKWTVGTAARLGHYLQDFNLELLEDPIPRQDLGGMRRLRASLNIPIAAQESCVTLKDIFNVLANEAADIILVDQHRNGGLTGMRRAAAMVEAAGMPVYKHSGGELGISTAAATHALSTMPNNLLASQTYWQFLEGDIIQEPIAGELLENGYVEVSDRPGLGVMLDRRKLAHYHDVYLRKEVVDGNYEWNRSTYRIDDTKKPSQAPAWGTPLF
jgi:L-alanine-DL-glutamate epimerase-like enolase superfamily enzyme